ncbi:hypothetical protein [Microbacterium enclense]|uniref:hypothetical protein n=1 Tax=Microbacterium enclense TaxID=993073 RepID=UPI003F7DF74F
MLGKKTSTSDPWGASSAVADQDRLTENLAAPVVRYSYWQRKWAVRWVKWCIFLFFPAAIILGLAAIGNSMSATPDAAPAQSSTDLNSSPGKAAATAAVVGWLAQSPSPLPGGAVQSWDGYTTLAEPELTEAQQRAGLGGEGTLEVDSFTLAVRGSNGTTALYASTVEVRIVNGVASVISTPTLLPQLSTSTKGTSAGTTPWPGWSTVTTSSSVSSAVQAWATAFTSGDAAALRLAVGDPNSDHTYLTLSGASVKSASVGQAAAQPDEKGNAPAKPDTVIARVTLQLVWGASSSTTSAPSVTYDLLIENASSGSPRVVAWGGPGAGATLKPYQNALSADVVSGEISGSGATPAPTSSTSGGE